MFDFWSSHYFRLQLRRFSKMSSRLKVGGGSHTQCYQKLEISAAIIKESLRNV